MAKIGDMNRRALLSGLAGLTAASCARKHDSNIALNGKTVQFLRAAHAQTQAWVWYDSHYTKLTYPDGDVAPDHGVCADVVIRAYRGIGIDLQRLVHEDMAAHFDLYPKNWGLSAPDSSIDHRRVPNLRVFFARFGTALPVTQDPHDYQPGDIITSLPWGKPHAAIVSDQKDWLFDRLQVIQNAGFGVRQDDDLFRFPLTGHYRYGL